MKNKIILLSIVATLFSCVKEDENLPPYFSYIQQSGTIDIDENGEFYHNCHIEYDYRYSCYYNEDTFYNNFFGSTGVGSNLNLPEPDVIVYTNTAYELTEYIMPNNMDSVIINN